MTLLGLGGAAPLLGACSPAAPAADSSSTTPFVAPTLAPVAVPSGNGYYQSRADSGGKLADLSAVDVCGTASDQLTLAQGGLAEGGDAFHAWTLQTDTTATELSTRSAVTGCTATLISDNQSHQAELVVALRTMPQFPTIASFEAAASTDPTDPSTADLGIGTVPGRAKASPGGRTAEVVRATGAGLQARYWLGANTTLEVRLSLVNGGPTATQMVVAARAFAQRMSLGPLPRTREASTVGLPDLAPLCLGVAVPSALRGTPASVVRVSYLTNGDVGTCTWSYGALTARHTVPARVITAGSAVVVTPQAATTTGETAAQKAAGAALVTALQSRSSGFRAAS